MPFAAKSAILPASDVLLRQAVIVRASSQSVAVFNVPLGYLLTVSLVASLIEHERPIVWLRLEPSDADPATSVLSLIDAARRVAPDTGFVKDANPATLPLSPIAVGERVTPCPARHAPLAGSSRLVDPLLSKRRS